MAPETTLPASDVLRVDLERALLTLDRVAAQKILADACQAWSPSYAAEALVGAALSEIGEKWEKGEVALSQIYMSGRICEELVNQYLPPKDDADQEPPNIAIAVLDDYHLLGKRIVYSALRASGLSLLDYGRTTVDDVVDRVVRDGIDLLLISTLMLPSALRVKHVRAKLGELRPKTKIVVGGAPFRFDDQLWKEVGADAFGRDSSDAIKIVTALRG
ncbi:MAG: cobalamin B12-binding domain-containing protein [Chloroflexi bacterium]|nr:cobalamin B12-binding domain-containing protein [Chloroflexota bacterium]